MINGLFVLSVLDQKTLAINFVDEFQKNAYLGYTATAMEIFTRLKHTHFDDVLYPAKEVLNGESGDNGCAMYVAPIALVCAKNSALNLENEVRKAVAVTHVHEMAVNGAILQAIAIQRLIQAPNELNVDAFLQQMIDTMKQSGTDTDGPSFVQQLQDLKKLLTVTNPSDERVVNVLGHSSQALYSVPTAMYCFLRGIKNPSEVSLFNVLILILPRACIYSILQFEINCFLSFHHVHCRSTIHFGKLLNMLLHWAATRTPLQA